MSNGFSLNSATYSLEKYFSDYSVSEETQSKLDDTEVLVLPYPSLYGDSKYYFAPEAINFVKFCKNENGGLKTDILADEDKIEVRSLHSHDIWMPIILIGSNIILPTVIGIVSNYIYDRMKGREKEDCTVKVSFIINDGEKAKQLNYEGDAKTFKESFEKIDINKL